MIRCLSHVALCVSDMERSLEFYRDFIGMEPIMDLDISDDRIRRVLGIAEAKCRIVHLKLGRAVLELFQYSCPAGENRAAGLHQYDQALTHIGFDVSDLDRHVEDLKKKKIEFLGEPVEIRPGVSVVYFRGPDGEVCEFRQQPTSRPTH